MFVLAFLFIFIFIFGSETFIYPGPLLPCDVRPQLYVSLTKRWELSSYRHSTHHSLVLLFQQFYLKIPADWFHCLACSLISRFLLQANTCTVLVLPAGPGTWEEKSQRVLCKKDPKHAFFFFIVFTTTYADLIYIGSEKWDQASSPIFSWKVKGNPNAFLENHLKY